MEMSVHFKLCIDILTWTHSLVHIAHFQKPDRNHLHSHSTANRMYFHFFQIKTKVMCTFGSIESNVDSHFRWLITKNCIRLSVCVYVVEELAAVVYNGVNWHFHIYLLDFERSECVYVRTMVCGVLWWISYVRPNTVVLSLSRVSRFQCCQAGIRIAVMLLVRRRQPDGMVETIDSS